MGKRKKNRQVVSQTTNYIQTVGNFNPSAHVVNDTTVIHVTINVNVGLGAKGFTRLVHNVFAKIPSSVKTLIRAHLFGVGIAGAVPYVFAGHPIFLLGVLQALALLYKDENAISIKYISKFLQIEQDNLTIPQAMEMAQYESGVQEKQK